MSNNFFEIPLELVSWSHDSVNDLPSYRTVFMRDRDRVLYCTAFRRLAGKTQIYTIGTDDHKKNRLTHSLEVAQIARTISHALNLNCDLAEAIALAHDFGHTPFGHAGEHMLHQIMIPESEFVKKSPFYQTNAKDIKKILEREGKEFPSIISIESMFGFKHNIQSVRVASVLEDSYRGSKGENIGLNLTNYTLWGMLNHSKIRYEDSSLYPNFQTQFNKLIGVNGFAGEAWSFEAYIVRIADDIAQWHHDLEDAIRGDALPISKICDTIKDALDSCLKDSDRDCLSNYRDTTRIDRKCIADLSHIVVNTLVNDIVETSKNNMDKLQKELQKNFPGTAEKELTKKLYTECDALKLSQKPDEIISLSSKIKQEKFKTVITEAVHHSRDVERMNEKGKYIIRKLFEAYYSHPQQLPDGPIFHFMVDIEIYANIDEARERGSGEVRTQFDKVLENPPKIYEAILMRRICDHIASMTDHYAIEEYGNLYG